MLVLVKVLSGSTSPSLLEKACAAVSHTLCSVDTKGAFVESGEYWDADMVVFRFYRFYVSSSSSSNMVIPSAFDDCTMWMDVTQGAYKHLSSL
jgi:hypothetical protein